MVVFWQVRDPVRAGVIGGDVVLGPNSFISSMDLNGPGPPPPTVPVNSKLAAFFGVVISHRNFTFHSFWYCEVLGWQKSSFRFFQKMLTKNQNELFGQPNTWNR